MITEQITTMLAKPGFSIAYINGTSILDCTELVDCSDCIFDDKDGNCTIIDKDQITDKQLAELQITHPEQFI